MSPLGQNIIAHLWESTLFGVACCLFYFALRKSSSSLRHLIAWASLTKFLIPFSLFSSVGVWFRNALFNADSTNEGVGAYVNLLTQTIQIDTWMPLQEGAIVQETTVPWESLGLAIWLIGFVALHLFWIQRYWKIKGSIDTECADASPEWRRLALRIWEKSPEAMPRLLICQNADLLAGLFGFLRPRVIIPASFDCEFDEAEREAFLRHEFQHLYKKDNLWLLVQTSIRNLFWIHPLIWWSNRQVSVEREIMRDSEVIRKTQSASSYLKCLLKASTTQLPSSYATSLGIKGAPFKKRVEAIGNGKGSILINTLATIGSIAGISALSLVLSMSTDEIDEKLDDLSSDIRKVGSEMDKKVRDLQEQINVESQKREEILRVAASNKRAGAASEEASRKVESSEANEDEPPKIQIQPRLPEDEQAMFRRVRALIKTDREAAMELLFSEMDEDSSSALYFLAGSFLGQNDEVEKAVDFFEIAVEKFPNFLRANRNAGIMHVQLGDFDKAKTYLLKAQSLGEPNTTTNGLLGLSYLSTGDPVSAEHNYRSAIDLDPEVRDWWGGLARSLSDQGKHAESEAVAAQIEERFGP